MGAVDGRVAIGIPTHRYLPDNSTGAHAVGGLAGGVPGVDELSVGFDRHQMVGEFGEFIDRLLPAHRHGDAHRHLGRSQSRAASTWK